jgi:hypothetical protein
MFMLSGFPNAKEEAERMDAYQILKALQDFNEIALPKQNI